MNKPAINRAGVKARFWQVATSVSTSFPLEATLIALRQLDPSGDLDDRTVRHRANALCFEIVREKLEIRGFELTACLEKIRELEQSYDLKCFSGYANAIGTDLDAAKLQLEEKQVFVQLMEQWQSAVAQFIHNGG